MMGYLVPLKAFDKEDLLDLLQACAHNLAIAYQETQVDALFFTSEQARDACAYLLYELQKEMPKQFMH